jgi:transcriptional regulator with XRE-family HTH domain
MVNLAMATRKVTLTASRNGRAVRERIRQDIDRLCQDAGISQHALSLASGIPQSYISDILNGIGQPSIETYARLSAALGADLNARVYPNTGPAIRDRHSVPILEALLESLHPRWQRFTEVRVSRPGRGWIDIVLHEERERILVAGEVQSTLNRIEQLIRWCGEKADSLPSWDGWPQLSEPPTVSRLLLVRWTRSTRNAASAAARQLHVAYPAHPDDALAALTGDASWPGPALIWARAERGGARFVGSR